MKLIEMKCPNCKSSVEVDSNQKEFTCGYCRTTTLIDEEIIKVEHTIKDAVIEEKIKVANTYLFDFDDYEKATETYKKLSEEYPYESKVWWGLILCETEKLKEYEGGFDRVPDFDICDDYFDKYKKVEKDDVKKDENTKKYNEYKAQFGEENITTDEEYRRIENETTSAIIKIALFVLGLITITLILLCNM